MKRKNYSLLICNLSYCLLFVLFGFLSDSAYSQGAAVNTTGASADPSAILDLSSNNSGILIPRMTEAQKNSINTPATGLMIYQTDGATGFWYYDGNVWLQSLGAAGATGAIGATGATGSAGTSGLLPSGTSAGNTPYWDGSQWVVNSSNIFNNGGSVGINTTNPDGSAYLDVSGTNKGMLIPRMTTAERNLIGSPAQGLQIFNTTTMCFEYFAYGIWQSLGCATCPVPYAAGFISGSALVCQGQSGVLYSVPAITNATSYVWAYSGTGATINGTTNSITIDFAANATLGNLTVKGNNVICGDGAISPNFAITINASPAASTAGTHTPSETQIIWNWNTVSGATGYKYNTANNYSTATDNGTNTSYTQTGLICNTPYTLYVWAYSVCGNSTATSLNQTTSACPFICGTSSITFTYKGSSVSSGSVNGGYNSGQYCWLDRNLGASAVATAVDHVAAYGDLFQWGRLDDGHQTRTGGTTSTLSSNDIPGHSNFIIAPNSPYDWRNPQNGALWQGASGINNPCPSGWRLPTATELNNEVTSWSQNNWIGAIASPLKLPAAGNRDYSNGTLSDVGSYGNYWSSTVIGTNVRDLYFYSSNANMHPSGFYRAGGMSIRCLRDY